MKTDSFCDLLVRAQHDDVIASELLVEAYMPLVNKYSYVDGVLDEDCRQFILLRVFIAIKNFQI